MYKLLICLIAVVAISVIHENVRAQSYQDGNFVLPIGSSVEPQIDISDKYQSMYCGHGTGGSCKYYCQVVADVLNGKPHSMLQYPLIYVIADTLFHCDTFVTIYANGQILTHCTGGADGGCPSPDALSRRYVFCRRGYYDNNIYLSSVSKKITLYTSKTGHYDTVAVGVLAFNNKLDSVSISNWSTKSIFTIDIKDTMSNSMPSISSLSLGPRQANKQLYYYISTPELATRYDRQYDLTVTAKASYLFDSTLASSFVVVLKGDPKSSVSLDVTSTNPLEIYPNPSNKGIVHLRYRSTEHSRFMLTIFNELGIEIKQFVNENNTSDGFEVTTILPTGTYYVRAQEGEKIYTKKLLVRASND